MWAESDCRVISPELNLRSFRLQRSDFIVEIIICIGCPIIQVIFCKYGVQIISISCWHTKDYFMQEFRFGIYEEIGCLAALRNYGLSNMLLTSMPILFPLASLTLYSRTYFMIYLTFITNPTQLRSFGNISSVSEALTTNLITLQISTATCMPDYLHSA